MLAALEVDTVFPMNSGPEAPCVHGSSLSHELALIKATGKCIYVKYICEKKQLNSDEKLKAMTSAPNSQNPQPIRQRMSFGSSLNVTFILNSSLYHVRYHVGVLKGICVTFHIVLAYAFRKEQFVMRNMLEKKKHLLHHHLPLKSKNFEYLSISTLTAD